MPFAINLQPETITISKGQLAQFSVLITRTGALTGNIRLTAHGIPPGSTFTFSIEGQNVYLKDIPFYIRSYQPRCR